MTRRCVFAKLYDIEHVAGVFEQRLALLVVVCAVIDGCMDETVGEIDSTVSFQLGLDSCEDDCPGALLDSLKSEMSD
jgi:hypothetical protein